MENQVHINRKTFEGLYASYAGKLYRIAFYELKNEDDAANMVHDVFISLWEKRGQLILDKPEFYLTRAIKLKIINYYRDKQRRQSIMHDMLNYDDSDHSTEEILVFRSLKQEVNELLEKLPERCRKIYHLHHDNGLENQEIASSLQISESAVRQHLAKAKNFLRKHLQY
ncbi:RNA polymerase sigma-70 factor [Olivibacter ginsenosidimutans]|uniref:RNA polymerase sigma-70 factor n=1 Tax=Olivibacter ginsenosidimutans TaxID=1176537 RepID=A0ABP9CF77_9SPHI